MKFITIFRSETGSTETWLQVNKNETVTYHTENSGWRMSRRGIEPKEEVMSIDEAKKQWASYAAEIDAALAKLKS